MKALHEEGSVAVQGNWALRKSAAYWSRLYPFIYCVPTQISRTLSLGRQLNKKLVTVCNTFTKLEPRFVPSMLRDLRQISRSEFCAWQEFPPHFRSKRVYAWKLCLKTFASPEVANSWHIDLNHEWLNHRSACHHIPHGARETVAREYCS